MGKPIEFEPWSIKSDYPRKDGSVVGLRLSGEHVVFFQSDPAPNALFDSPAKLRELAAAITRAADALEKSQRLTFADLKPGEWFRWDNPPHNTPASFAPLRKIDDRTIINSDNWHGSGDPCVSGNWDGQPVVRVAAAFQDKP